MTLPQYLRLIDTQARMALKSDAANLVLGYVWWILEPLLYVMVFYVVFATRWMLVVSQNNSQA